MSYRSKKAPKCDEPAETWMEKMMARIKESWVAEMIKDAREHPLAYLGVTVGLVIILALVLMVTSSIVAVFRDPILLEPPCSQRCQKLGATQYRIEAKNIVLSYARAVESNCACQFEDGRQMNLVPGEWRSIDE